MPHTFYELFDQLGLPNTKENIEEFIKSHQLPAFLVFLWEAPWWTYAQADFLECAIAEDAEWALVVDQLNACCCQCRLGAGCEVKLREVIKKLYGLTSYPVIIGISGISGSGKKTLMKKLSEKLVDCIAVYSNQEKAFNCYLELKGVRARYIVLEAPLASYPFVFKKYDFLVFLNTPLDIALARRLVRDYTQRVLISKNHTNILYDINHYLASWNLTQSLIDQVRKNTDVIIDGSLPIEQQANSLLSLLSIKEEL